LVSITKVREINKIVGLHWIKKKKKKKGYQDLLYIFSKKSLSK